MPSLNKIKNIATKITNLEPTSIGIIVVAVVGVSITYSSAKIIQKNYILQKEIVELRQQIALQEQTNKNQSLNNEYYKTDAYLDIAARRYSNKVAPGEKLYLVSDEVANKYIAPMPEEKPENTAVLNNWQKWINFLTGSGAGY